VTRRVKTGEGTLACDGDEMGVQRGVEGSKKVKVQKAGRRYRERGAVWGGWRRQGEVVSVLVPARVRRGREIFPLARDGKDAAGRRRNIIARWRLQWVAGTRAVGAQDESRPERDGDGNEWARRQRMTLLRTVGPLEVGCDLRLHSRAL
jgi:hypothetical protein